MSISTDRILEERDSNYFDGAGTEEVTCPRDHEVSPDACIHSLLSTSAEEKTNDPSVTDDQTEMQLKDTEITALRAENTNLRECNDQLQKELTVLRNLMLKDNLTIVDFQDKKVAKTKAMKAVEQFVEIRDLVLREEAKTLNTKLEIEMCEGVAIVDLKLRKCTIAQRNEDFSDNPNDTEDNVKKIVTDLGKDIAFLMEKPIRVDYPWSTADSTETVQDPSIPLRNRKRSSDGGSVSTNRLAHKNEISQFDKNWTHFQNKSSKGRAARCEAWGYCYESKQLPSTDSSTASSSGLNLYDPEDWWSKFVRKKYSNIDTTTAEADS